MTQLPTSYKTIRKFIQVYQNPRGIQPGEQSVFGAKDIQKLRPETPQKLTHNTMQVMNVEKRPGTPT